ncbi:hypothetical protein ACLOJK_036430, partial [Asimina triloba]
IPMARTASTTPVVPSSSKGKRKVVYNPSSMFHKKSKLHRCQSGVRISKGTVHLHSSSSPSSSGSSSAPSPKKIAELAPLPPSRVKKGVNICFTKEEFAQIMLLPDEMGVTM